LGHPLFDYPTCCAQLQRRARRYTLKDMSNPSERPSKSKTAVLLINLGTPDAPSPSAVRRYLAEFLSDRRVIDYPRWLWLPLLYAVILCIRPRQSAEAYRKVWTARGSPLQTFSRDLTDALGKRCGELPVELAMTYGQPAIRDVVNRLLQQGVTRILALPLFPQYSATSTGAAFDSLFAALQRLRNVPEIRTVASYHAMPEYIDALAGSVREFWNAHGKAPRLLLSFHGIPQRYVRLGDPYQRQCTATAAALRRALDLDEHSLPVSFQSRVGREKWLEPYTDEMLRQLPAQGVRHLQVLCPGFAVDCLETLEEIAIRGKEQFIGCGGERLEYIPALNAGPAHVRVLQALVKRHIAGWDDADCA
jgi:ferrochelatase